MILNRSMIDFIAEPCPTFISWQKRAKGVFRYFQYLQDYAVQGIDVSLIWLANVMSDAPWDVLGAFLFDSGTCSKRSSIKNICEWNLSTYR